MIGNRRKVHIAHIVSLSILAWVALCCHADAVTAGQPPLPQGLTYHLPNGVSVTTVRVGAVPKVEISVGLYFASIRDERCWRKTLANVFSKRIERDSDIFERLGGYPSISQGDGWLSISLDTLSPFGSRAVLAISGVLTARDSLQKLNFDFHAVNGQRWDADNPYVEAMSQVAAILNSQGTKEACPSLERADLEEEKFESFVKLALRPANLHVFVVGEFSRSEIRRAITVSLGRPTWYPRHLVPLTPAESGMAAVSVGHPKLPSGVWFVDRPESSVATVYMAAPIPDFRSVENAQMEVASAMLGGEHQSIITDALRRQFGFSYSPMGSVTVIGGHPVWLEAFDVPSDKLSTAVTVVFSAIKAFEATPIPGSKLNEAKSFCIALYRRHDRSRQNMVSNLRFASNYGEPLGILQDHINAIENVDASSVQTVMNHYISRRKFIVVVVGDKRKVQSQLVSVGDLNGFGQVNGSISPR